MANRNDFPGLLSVLRDFDWSNFGADTGGQSTSAMPLAMMAAQRTTPLMLPPGLLDYNPDAGSQGQDQVLPQTLPQLDMLAARQNNGYTDGLDQPALDNRIDLPVTPSGEPIDTILLPDPSKNEKSWRLRKPQPLPPPINVYDFLRG